MPKSSDARRAYARAQEKIAHALKTRAKKLDLSGAHFGEVALTALDRLPPELAEATALQGLNLRGTRVTDLTPLQSLTALQSLYLWNTQITDLTPLQSLTALRSLDLRGTQVNDLTPLQSLTALQSLDLERTQVTDLTPLQSLTALQSLNLTRTQVTDLTPLQSLTALRSLDLGHTKVTDLRPIRDLPQMDGVGQTVGGFGITNENGLYFQATEATRRDPVLARLSKIDDPAERTQATLAYLRGRASYQPLGPPPSGPDPQTTRARPSTVFRHRNIRTSIDMRQEAEWDAQILGLSERDLERIGRTLKDNAFSPDTRKVQPDVPLYVRHLAGVDVLYLITRSDAEVVITIGHIVKPDPAKPLEVMLKTTLKAVQAGTAIKDGVTLMDILRKAIGL